MRQAINLYLYLPKADTSHLLTKKIITAYLIFLLCLILLFLISYLQFFVFKKHLHTAENQLEKAQLRWDQTYTTALKNETAQLSENISRLRQQLEENQQILAHTNVGLLSNTDHFVDKFDALSKIDLPQIQLTAIRFLQGGNKVIFTGLTNNSLAVIYFIKKLRLSPAYQGLAFSTLNMDEQPQNTAPEPTEPTEPPAQQNHFLTFTITSDEVAPNDTVKK